MELTGRKYFEACYDGKPERYKIRVETMCKATADYKLDSVKYDFFDEGLEKAVNYYIKARKKHKISVVSNLVDLPLNIFLEIGKMGDKLEF